MMRKGGWLAEQRLIPFEAARHVADPYDRPRALQNRFYRPEAEVAMAAVAGARSTVWGLWPKVRRMRMIAAYPQAMPKASASTTVSKRVEETINVFIVQSFRCLIVSTRLVLLVLILGQEPDEVFITSVQPPLGLWSPGPQVTEVTGLIFIHSTLH